MTENRRMNRSQPVAISPAMLAWIDALAERDVADYLTEQAALRQAAEAERTERVPLPAMGRAA